MSNNLPKTRDLLRESLEIYKNNFLIFLSIAVIYSLVSSPKNNIFFSFLGFFALLWLRLTTLYIIKNKDQKSFPAIYLVSSLKYLLPLLLVSFLEFFVLFGGFVLLIIPAIILLFYTILYENVFFFEGLRGFNALSKSAYYTKNNLPYIAKTSAKIILINIAITCIFYFPSNLLLNKNFLEYLVNFFMAIEFQIIAICYFLIYLSLSKQALERDPNQNENWKIYKSKLIFFGVIGILSFTGLMSFLSS